MSQTTPTAKGVLYVVATPIGNLGDMTLRACDCLKGADLIACEDTRTSGKLLQHFGIKTKQIAYHDHNADHQTAVLIERLRAGQSIALISDAGTPLVSDPGFRLVKACHDNAITVSPIVGASASIAALSVSGLPSDRFYFYGFLPAKSAARTTALKHLAPLETTLIFYEAPHRILACLEDLLTVFGERQVCFCRELTKTFETVRHTTLSALLSFVTSDPNQQKGEMVLVVAGANDNQDHAKSDEVLALLLDELPLKKAVNVACAMLGLKKNALYERALQLKQQK